MDGKMRTLCCLRTASTVFLFLSLGCLEWSDAADEAENKSPAEEPVTEQQALVIGGCQCPGWQPGVTCGELSYGDIPVDDSYYITTFGGPGDGQDMWICGYQSTANGTWPYMANYERFGCGKVKIVNPQTNKYCIAEVADCGPNKCVEEAACYCTCQDHHPILDVSPFITQALFGISSSGYSEKREVIAWQVASDTPIGCPNDPIPTTGFLKGVVYESPDTDDRISGAAVSLDTGQSTTSNSSGYWEFELSPGTYTATALKTGYLAGSSTRTVAAGAEVWGSIGLLSCGCADANVCTTDLCDPWDGCYYLPATGSCNDSDACTEGDACIDGLCKGTDISSSCWDDNLCTDDACSPSTGCVFVPLDGIGCNDGSLCTAVDSCFGGSCTGNDISSSCDDGNPCTNDSCGDTSGCLNVPLDGIACDDSNACTTADTCSAWQCAGTDTGGLCDSGTPCTEAYCDPDMGCAVFPLDGLSCNDGNACTADDICLAGACVGTFYPGFCNDGNPCTSDLCDPSSGCINQPLEGIACNDGNACTTADQCANGLCLGTDASSNCKDDNPCTDDGCDLVAGCYLLPNALPCDDGDACTGADQCSSGVCLPGAPVSCLDGNPCTNDSCQPEVGCAFEVNALACEDGNACTVGDICANGACQPGAMNACVDGNPCTTDGCDPTSGTCQFVANSIPCDDSDACTKGDVCAGGLCQPGALPACDDGNPCTDDSCDPGTGDCLFAVNGNVCSDGNACTQNDICQAGECIAGEPIFCQDGNPCTDDICDSFSGECLFQHNSANCDDGNPCTQGEVCAGGSCQLGTTAACDDGNPCTDDACDNFTGECVFQHNSAFCDDGNPCTDNACVNGTCHTLSLLSGCCLADSDCNVPAEQCRLDDSSCIPTHCLPCEGDGDCGEAGNQCVPGPAGAAFCAVQCDEDPGVCPEDSHCQKIQSDSWLCLPVGEACDSVDPPEEFSSGEDGAPDSGPANELWPGEVLTDGQFEAGTPGEGDVLTMGEAKSRGSCSSSAGSTGFDAASVWLLACLTGLIFCLRRRLRHDMRGENG